MGAGATGGGHGSISAAFHIPLYCVLFFCYAYMGVCVAVGVCSGLGVALAVYRMRLIETSAVIVVHFLTDKRQRSREPRYRRQLLSPTTCNAKSTFDTIPSRDRRVRCCPSHCWLGVIPHSGELQQLWWSLEKGGVGDPRITVENFRELLLGRFFESVVGIPGCSKG